MNHFIKGLLFVLFLLFTSSLLAQEFEDFVRQRKQQQEQFAQQREQAIKELAREREAYMKKINREYARYLKRQWKAFRVFSGQKRREEPEPDVQPEFNEAKALSSGPTDVSKETEQKPLPSPELPVMSGSSSAEKPELAGHTTVSFYGAHLDLSYAQGFIPSFDGQPDEQTIGRKFAQMNQAASGVVLEQLLNARQRLQLNDWGYYMLVRQVSNQLSQPASNASRMMQWFFLVRSNYKVKLGYRGNNLFVLLPTSHELYSIPFLSIDNKKYYMMGASGSGQIHTYQKDYPEARQLIDMNMPRAVNLPEDKAKRTLKIGGKKHAITYNVNVVNYYQDFPLMDLSVYFNAAVSNPTKESLINTLQPLLADKDTRASVNFLLDFVQNLPYKNDQEQFDRENFMFPEQVFHYPYSDCEDRSVLFSYLVQELLDVPAVGLVYSDHVSTALRFEAKQVDGRYVHLDGQKFVVCDPTYKNAPAGMMMPKYRDRKARIVRIQNRPYKTSRSRKIWAFLGQHGAARGSNDQSIAFDPKDHAYVTGYFKGTLTVGGRTLRSSGQSKDIFYARFNPENQLEWIRSISGAGSDIGTHIQLDRQGHLYLAGSFHKNLKTSSTQLKTKDLGDVFLARCNTEGHIKWIRQLNMKHIKSEKNLVFAAQYSPHGALNWKRLLNEEESFDKPHIDFDQNNNVLLSGALHSVTGLRMKTTSYASYNELNSVSSLKKRTDQLVDQRYHPSIAGLFAVINLVENSGIVIEGDVAQRALDRYNPDFKKRCPSIYENIGKIDFLKNERGIVTLKTDDGQRVKLSNMKVSNNSKMKITTYRSGNAKVDVLSGVKVGKAFVWFDLNHIRLYKGNGNLVFDYDDDHSRKEIAMTEILD